MRSVELKPTRENLLRTLNDDLLKRNKDVWYFAKLCDSQESSCSIAIDGKWGSGKTFFVKHTQLLIESCNPFIQTVSDEEREQISGYFKSFKKSSGDDYSLDPEVCVYYDAWSNDNDEDPILSIVYSIMQSTKYFISFEKHVDCFSTAASIVDLFAGSNAMAMVDLFKSADPLSALRDRKEVHSLVEEFLDSLLSEKGNRLIVFVDELDRCKPEFAVKLLERIKHYFSNERITFVFSVNLEELQHSIRNYYGEGVDATRYLDRFFDYRLTLPKLDLSDYYRSLGFGVGGWVYDEVGRSVIDYCEFELRDISKYLHMLKVSAYKVTHKNSTNDGLRSDSQRFVLCIFIPIIIGLRMYDIDIYNDFIEGKNDSPLIEIMGDGDTAIGFCNSLLNYNETYSTAPNNGKTTVNLSDKLHSVYIALFDPDKQAYGESRVGDLIFDDQVRKQLIRVSSLLSEYTDYC